MIHRAYVKTELWHSATFRGFRLEIRSITFNLGKMQIQRIGHSEKSI